MTHEHKNHPRRLLDFRFKRHNRNNLSPERLVLVEFALQCRVKGLSEDERNTHRSIMTGGYFCGAKTSSQNET